VKTDRELTALITGSSRGIGKAIAIELASQGISIILNYIDSDDEATGFSQEMHNNDLNVLAIKADVADRSQVKMMVARTIEEFGKIDILVNNAGITLDKTIRNLSHGDWDSVISVNLTGVFNVTKEVLPHMIPLGRGCIINISSVIGQTGAVGQSNYSASKAGVIGFSKSCALEVARYGITVNAICPGYVETDMLRAVPADVLDKIKQRIPLRRFARPEEIAKLVRFLATEGDYITGQCININGGVFTG
jgi:acetoacetyl-CoA reductase